MKVFFVKNCYIANTSAANCVNDQECSKWRRIWNLKIHDGIKILLWRL